MKKLLSLLAIMGLLISFGCDNAKKDETEKKDPPKEGTEKKDPPKDATPAPKE